MQLNDDAMQDKLILLYVLDRFEVPLTADNLNTICTVDNAWLNYYALSSVIHDLRESNFISESATINKKPAYTLTPDGRLCLSYFSTRIPASIRDEILATVADKRLHYKKNQEFFSDYKKNTDGTYTVTLKIDSPQNLLEINLTTDTKANAERFYKGWFDKASQVYEALYDIMNE